MKRATDICIFVLPCDIDEDKREKANVLFGKYVLIFNRFAKTVFRLYQYF
ncbi:MAG: hypothetical protein L6V93_09655 [Clostridiales bacterium]|nr:MAG: hypothetical protein L6V93_09655 [Clostridiales bacterium]